MTIHRKLPKTVTTGLPLCRARDLYALPEGGPRYQLIHGILHMAPSPSFSHQNTSTDLLILLGNHVKQHNLGVVLSAPMDVELDSHNVYQPDLLFISKARHSIIHPQRIKGAPDLIIEILSKSTRKLDEVAKRQQYQENGVKELWLVDVAKKTIVVHDFANPPSTVSKIYTGSNAIHTPLLPGFRLDLAALFGS